MKLPELPVHLIVPELKAALADSSAVLSAPPGSGKTTIVPLALLDEPWLKGKKILILEPRRLAARAAAARMASILGERVGKTVGYQVRFDSKISGDTVIEVLTEGILTRRIQNSADLNGVGLVIFDEFHERSIHADLALALCLDLCQIKEDLRLLVMSATLETGTISRLLGDVPVITGEGQSHGVAIDYLEQEAKGRISDVTSANVRKVVKEQQGDVLVFLPGAGEIKDVHRQLGNDESLSHIRILPLFGDLSQKEQDLAIMACPDRSRRIILATSIAETSITIEGVGCVIDSGWSRRPRFEPGNGLTRLATIRVSRAAARQRAGRAGRLGPGYCLRLWTRAEHHSLIPFHPPEIVAVDLANLVLELALWGVSDPAELCWLDPPRSGPYKQAETLLLSLGAVDKSGRITDAGKRLASLPMHPRLGYMLLMAGKMGQGSMACDIAAILSERDILRHTSVPTAELQLRQRILVLWREKGSGAVEREGGDPVLCRRVDALSRQYQKHVGRTKATIDSDVIGNLLTFAYPDRIARRRGDQRGRYLLASGRGALLPPADPLALSEYLIVPKLDAGQREGKIFLAEPLSLADLKNYHQALLSVTEQVRWDSQTSRVIASRRLALGEILVEEKPLSFVEPAEITRMMLAGIKQMGIDCLPWDRESRQFQIRVKCLRDWQPEVDWPDFDDATLIKDLSLLEPYLVGIRRGNQLSRLNLVKIFKGVLGWEKQKRLERDAPVSIAVPSGSKIRMEYRPGEPPLLAVRIQEMFGKAITPAICGGRVVVLLHLLSPARRPIQVTSDLAGFWQRSYPEIKKELKGRYPKHFWPDDPLAAEAVKGVKRKTKR